MRNNRDRPEPHYRVGDSVVHPEHGQATVTFIGSEYVGLRFRDGRDVLSRIEQLDPRSGRDEMVEAGPIGDVAPDLLQPWPDSTFLTAVDDQRHIPGMHWMPFSEEGAESFFERIAELCSQSSLLPAYGNQYRAQRTPPGDWPEGMCIAWPEGGEQPGIVMTLVVTEMGNELVSFNPHGIGSGEHTVRLVRVHVWEGGLEAQVEAVWNGSIISFFDTAFPPNRTWYEAGRDYCFRLAGIAYGAQHAEKTRIPLERHPDESAWLRMLAEEFGEPPPEDPGFLELTGGALLLPATDMDIDDYHFRGPVKEVDAFDDFLGEPGWRLRVTVTRLDGEDGDLDIFVTRRAWRSGRPPSVGEDIEGRLWLQGCLSSVPSHGTIAG